jgi:hypothetical protein
MTSDRNSVDGRGVCVAMNDSMRRRRDVVRLGMGTFGPSVYIAVATTQLSWQTNNKRSLILLQHPVSFPFLPFFPFHIPSPFLSNQPNNAAFTIGSVLLQQLVFVFSLYSCCFVFHVVVVVVVVVCALWHDDQPGEADDVGGSLVVVDNFIPLLLFTQWCCCSSTHRQPQ